MTVAILRQEESHGVSNLPSGSQLDVQLAMGNYLIVLRSQSHAKAGEILNSLIYLVVYLGQYSIIVLPQNQLEIHEVTR